MSDTKWNVSGKKLIGIRPVEAFRPKPSAGLQEDGALAEKSLKESIQELEQEIARLKDTKENLISDTKEQIQLEKEKWEEEKKLLKEQAEKEGYQAGFQAGKQEGLLEFQEKIELANSNIETAMADYHATVERSSESILDLAIHTAEKILAAKISEEPSSFKNIVAEALKEIKDRSALTIFLNPKNYSHVVQHREELERGLNEDTVLSILIDDNLAENSCLIDHPFGQIDAGVDTQLASIQEVLHNYLLEQKL